VLNLYLIEQNASTSARSWASLVYVNDGQASIKRLNHVHS